MLHLTGYHLDRTDRLPLAILCRISRITDSTTSTDWKAVI